MVNLEMFTFKSCIHLQLKTLIHSTILIFEKARAFVTFINFSHRKLFSPFATSFSFLIEIEFIEDKIIHFTVSIAVPSGTFTVSYSHHLSRGS